MESKFIDINYCTGSVEQNIVSFKLFGDFILTVTLFDTSGLDRFYKIGLDRPIKNADSILFVYDITKKESFNLFDSRYRSLIEENQKI